MKFNKNLPRLKNLKSYFFIAVIASICFTSCKDEEPVPDVDKSKQVLLSNEGNFGQGNGSLSIYYPKGNLVSNKAFESINQEKLGDVFQSIEQIGNDYYFVVNNSGKIVISSFVYQKRGEITGFTSPRYIIPVTESKAYVTDLFSNHIYVVDLDSRTITDSIAVSGWCERGLTYNNSVWVTSPAGEYMYEIDATSDQLVDSVKVGQGNGAVILDKNNQLWVTASGIFGENKGFIASVDPETKEVTQSKELDGSVSGLVYNSITHTLYFLNGGVNAASVGPDINPQVIYTKPNANFYAVGLDPEEQEIYVSDALDFQQSSTITRLDLNGNTLDEFKAGVATGNFFFP